MAAVVFYDHYFKPCTWIGDVRAGGEVGLNWLPIYCAGGQPLQLNELKIDDCSHRLSFPRFYHSFYGAKNVVRAIVK